MLQAIDPGEYNAKLMGWEAGFYYGKWGFYLVIDAIIDGQPDPHRMRHYINERYKPSIWVARIAGWITNDDVLKNLSLVSIEDLKKQPMGDKRNWGGIDCRIVVDKSSYNGKERNDVLDMFPYHPTDHTNKTIPGATGDLKNDIPDDGLSGVTTAIKDMFHVEPTKLQPLGFEAGSDDVPF